ncbi:MAG: VWA domain-containing protein [Planctomycetales bacterium]|nr:VWA domain-containing protein [Planctomycetales bacterium]
MSLDQFAKKIEGLLTDVFQGATRALAKKHDVPRQSPPLLPSGEQPHYLPNEEEDDGPEIRQCVLVLDVSGSMSSPDWKPSRLAAAKAAAREFAIALAETDSHAFLGVVAYGSEAHIACTLNPIRQLNLIFKAIESLEIEGSTNFTKGLDAAAELFSTTRSQDNFRQVVLLSDGYNTGPNPFELAEDLKDYAVIECVGCAGTPESVDEELMREIASWNETCTEKRYRWVGEPQELTRHFVRLAQRPLLELTPRSSLPGR